MTTFPDAASYEHQHVHIIYDTIAPHFSNTRYKPWPKPHSFLSSLPSGSIGIDAGCGNGKYLSSNPHIFILGSDRSAPLVSIAARNHTLPTSHSGTKDTKPRPNSADTAVADALHLPHPPGIFDFAISIAVLHHLSTRERRVAGLQEILRLLRPSERKNEGGKALVFVWALEQSTSRRGWKEGGMQDVMVPWVLQGGHKDAKTHTKDAARGVVEGQPARRGDGETSGEEEKVYERYYHLYAAHELETDVHAAGGRVIEAGYERDNWWCVMAPRLPGLT